MGARILDLASVLLGVGFMVILGWSFARPHGGLPVRTSSRRLTIACLFGVGFGSTWAAEAIVRLFSDSSALLWMQATAGTLLALFYGGWLLARLRPDALSFLAPLLSRYEPGDEVHLDVEMLARRGETLAAVKALRAQTGASLRDAVAQVRAMQRELRLPSGGSW